MRTRLLSTVLLAGGLCPFRPVHRPTCSVRTFLGSCRERSSAFVGNEGGNITLLVYRGERIPREARDAEEIVLGVCKNEGVQQIVWISRLAAIGHGLLEWRPVVPRR